MRKVLLTLTCLFLFSISGAWNLGELRDECRKILKDNTTDTQLQRYSSSTLNMRFNMGQEDAVYRTFCLHAREYLETGTTTYEYTISSTCIMVEKVSYNTNNSTWVAKYDKIDYTTEATLDRDYAYWETSSSNVPSQYYYRADKIGLYPPPSYTYSGARRLRIDYIKRPETLERDADVPFDNNTLLYQFHNLLIWYTCAVCKYGENDKTIGDFYWAKYLADIETMKKILNSRPDKSGQFNQ